MAEDDTPRCGARRKGSTHPCKMRPIAGGTRCHWHGGAAPQVRAAANRRLALAKAEQLLATYGRPIDTDPVTALLAEVRWTAGHVAWLRERIQAMEERALIWGQTKQEDKRATEFEGINTIEAAVPHVWLDLYQRERKHLVDVCKVAIAAGIEERRVRLAEQQGDLVVQVLQGILADLHLTPEQEALVPAAASRHLRLVS